jgi:sensor histidine kinase YesM
MKNSQFYNHIAFRVLSPPLAGLIFYLLILIFFDSVESLADNFFSRELLFVVVLTFLFFEANRLVMVLLNLMYPKSGKMRFRIITQYLFAFVVTVAVVSIILWAYFVYFEGFTTIRTELFIFNGIYLFAAFFYHLYFFSFQFLFRRNEVEVEKESTLKLNLEWELKAYKNQINPEFLFQSLEIIISELHRHKKTADDLVDSLSKTYRYILDNKNTELISLRREMESIEPVKNIFRSKYGDLFSTEIELKEDLSYHCYLVPGTLQLLTEFALMDNIIAPSMPLHIRIYSANGKLEFVYRSHQKLNNDKPLSGQLESLSKAYNYYANEGIASQNNEGVQYFQVPLIEIEEE